MYKIALLDDEEFDALPYDKMGESMGCADPKTKTMYIRNMGDKLNAFNIAHELKHLDEGHDGDTADHFDGKVFHSWLSSLWRHPKDKPNPLSNFVDSAQANPLQTAAILGASIFAPQILGSVLGGGGAAAAAGGGYAANAGRVGAGMGYGLGSGTAAGSAAASGAAGFGGGLASKLGNQALNFGKGQATEYATNQLGNSLFGGGESPMSQFMPQEQGSYEPQVNQSQNPNVIAGAQFGEQGQATGAPGGIGGGDFVSKLRKMLQQRNQQQTPQISMAGGMLG